MRQWFVGVATQNRDHLAADELFALGYEVHKPMRFWRERNGNENIDRCKTLLTPYFFVRFDFDREREVNEEYTIALKQRGVGHILTNGRNHPSPIAASIIADHRKREFAEQNNASQPRTKKTATHLQLLKPYMIKRHSLFEGRVGTLFAVSRGMASLDWEGGLITIPDCDIAPHGWKPVEEVAKTATAA